MFLNLHYYDIIIKDPKHLRYILNSQTAKWPIKKTNNNNSLASFNSFKTLGLEKSTKVILDATV